MGLRGTRERRSGENYIIRSLIICPPHPILSGDQLEKNGVGGACSTYDGEKRRIQYFGGETEGKRPLGRPRCRREDNIKMDFQEMEWAHGLD